MNEQFAEKMRERDVAKDTRLLGDFAGVYCKGNHPDASRGPLVSDGAALGVYGRRVPEVCTDCAELLAYAEKRRAFCPRDPKPFCSYCDTHCYRPQMREKMRDVMKYSGPRSIVRGHAIDSVRHLAAGRRAKREREARFADSTTEQQR